MPIGTYLLFNGRHDDKTRLWLLAVTLMSIAMSLASFRPVIPMFWSFQLAWVLIAASMLLMIEVMQRELALKRTPRSMWLIPGLVMVAWSVYVVVIYLLGLTESLGVASNSLMMAILGGTLSILLMRLYRRMPSKSLKLLGIGVFLYSVPPLIRLATYLISGDPQSQNVLKFSFVTNVVVFSLIVAILFISLGYWGFTLEKSMHERNEARLGQQLAENDAEAMRQLVQQRDRLLVMNSRFSVVSALSSFSAMLIHDITQPLQTLQLGLERIRSDLVKGASRERLEADVEQLEKTMDRAGNLVSGLRTLMQSGESKAAPVLVAPLFDKIDSILSSEALNRRVTVVLENNLPHECRAMADEVMLQRVVINLVANALNQFKLNPVAAPKVTISLAREDLNDMPGLVIQVTDNGGGFPPELLERVGQPWSSRRPEGLGMALMLSKQLVGLWGGHLNLFNRTDGVAGAGVRIWLRKAEKTDKSENALAGIPKNGNTVF